MFSTQPRREHPAAAVLPQPDDTYIICYTSGTTGLPKGVQLTHANLIANIASLYVLPELIRLRQVPEPGDASISYLPLSHMFEQFVHWYMFSSGANVGYSQVCALSVRARIRTRVHRAMCVCSWTTSPLYGRSFCPSYRVFSIVCTTK
jgi:long-subunit acyl-CoA synthetase (AMP-forming)